jgi:hypothetical protein
MRRQPVIIEIAVTLSEGGPVIKEQFSGFGSEKFY